MTWVILVLWLAGDQRLPTPTGTMLQAREVFVTENDCAAAIPRFEAAVLRDFGERGIVACQAQTPPSPRQVAATN